MADRKLFVLNLFCSNDFVVKIIISQPFQCWRIANEINLNDTPPTPSPSMLFAMPTESVGSKSEQHTNEHQM